MIELHPLRTGIIRPGQDLAQQVLAAMCRQGLCARSGDILAISSKVVATSEGRIVHLKSIIPSARARRLSRAFDLDPRYVQVVLGEADEVLGGVRRALLTIKLETLAANAGVDRKNAPRGSVVLWPANPDRSAEQLRKRIAELTRLHLGVVIVDSRVAPLRMGTTGLALGTSGLAAVKDYRTKLDLFQRRIGITRHAIADDIASAAHVLMGEGRERISAVLVRNLGGGAPWKGKGGRRSIGGESCLYMRVLRPAHRNPEL